MMPWYLCASEDHMDKKAKTPKKPKQPKAGTGTKG